MPSSVIGRRALLGAGLALAAAPAGLAGCSPAATTPPRPSRDELAVTGTVTGITSLLTSYAAAVAAHPELTSRLDPLAAEHRAHVAALSPVGASPSALGTSAPAGSPVVASFPSVASPAGSASAGASPAPAATAPPAATAAAAVAALAAQERAQASQRQRDLADVSPPLARLLAGIGACEAAHAALLARPG